MSKGGKQKENARTAQRPTAKQKQAERAAQRKAQRERIKRRQRLRRIGVIALIVILLAGALTAAIIADRSRASGSSAGAGQESAVSPLTTSSAPSTWPPMLVMDENT